MHDRQRNIVVSSPNSADTPRYFRDWSSPPLHGYRTRNQWALEDRKPIKGEKAFAYFVELEPVEEFHRRLGVGLSDVIDYNGHECRATTRIPLFHESQTRPAKIHQRTKEYVYFCRLYNLSLHKYIENVEVDDKRKWKHSRSQELFESEPWRQNFFGVSKIKRHINGLEVLGGFAKDKVRVCYLDLDLHKGTLASVYLDGVRAIVSAIPDLLHHLHGSQLHFQVADRDAGGIHVGFLLEQPRESEDMVAAVRLWLGEQADKNQELHKSWVASGLKPWSKTEVFPCKTNGFRLPLCRGRTMLLDRPLALLPNGKQDLVSFMAYLRGTAPAMPVDDVVQYLSERLKTPQPAATVVDHYQEASTKRPRLVSTKASTPLVKTKIVWTKRTRPTLVRFWLGHDNPRGTWRYHKPIYDECRRVLKPGGVLAWSAGIKHYHHFAEWFGGHRVWTLTRFGKSGIASGHIWVVQTREQQPVPFPARDGVILYQLLKGLGSLHPCPKPVEEMAWLIEALTNPGDIILDCFCGLGSTLLAAERLGRRWIGCDRSRRYCQIAMRRLRRLRSVTQCSPGDSRASRE